LKVCFSSKGKLNYILWLGSNILLRQAAENEEQKKIVSLHGSWKMEARSVKMFLKAEKLPVTAKSLG